MRRCCSSCEVAYTGPCLGTMLRGASRVMFVLDATDRIQTRPDSHLNTTTTLSCIPVLTTIQTAMPHADRKGFGLPFSSHAAHPCICVVAFYPAVSKLKDTRQCQSHVAHAHIIICHLCYSCLCKLKVAAGNKTWQPGYQHPSQHSCNQALLSCSRTCMSKACFWSLYVTASCLFCCTSPCQWSKRACNSAT